MMKSKELHASNIELDFELNLAPGNVKGAMKTAGAGSRDLWQVPVAEIRVIPNFNVRTPGQELDDHVANIGESILTEGYYQDSPLAGYIAQEDGESIVYIYDGHCRLAAVKYAIKKGAEIDKLPVVVTPGNDMEDLTVALVRKNQGKALTPFELGIVCKRLVRMGRSESDIADRLGLSGQYVKNLLSLMVAPAEIREMVRSGTVSATVAIEVIAKHGDKSHEVLQKAKERATSAGKGKVTPRHVDPVDKMNKAARARAGDLFRLLSEICDSLEKKAQNGNALTVSGDDYDRAYTLVQEIKESGI